MSGQVISGTLGAFFFHLCQGVSCLRFIVLFK